MVSPSTRASAADKSLVFSASQTGVGGRCGTIVGAVGAVRLWSHYGQGNSLEGKIDDKTVLGNLKQPDSHAQ